MNRMTSRQCGLTAIELILSLTIMAVVTLATAQSFNRSQAELTTSAAATRLAEVRLAANRYIRDNFSAVAANAAAGPIEIPVSALIAANYLPPSYNNRNEFGQIHHIYLRARAPGVLESLTVTTGGAPLTLLQGGRIASLLKAAGGYVPIGSPDAIGAKGAWRAALGAFVPGGAAYPSGGAAAYALHRAVEGPTGALMRINTGNPADNRMSTDLDMGGSNLVNAATATTAALRTNALWISGQEVTLTDAQTLAALSAVSCGSGQLLTKSGLAFACLAAGAVPSGAIAAFDGACPDGWASYAPATDRVLVAAGGNYVVGQTGGSDTTKLTTDQLPAHSHRVAVLSDAGTAINWSPGSPIAHHGLYGNAPQYILTAGSGSAWVGPSSETGGGQPFDNRQQFIALNYCRKS